MFPTKSGNVRIHLAQHSTQFNLESVRSLNKKIEKKAFKFFCIMIKKRKQPTKIKSNKTLACNISGNELEREFPCPSSI